MDGFRSSNETDMCHAFARGRVHQGGDALPGCLLAGMDAQSDKQMRPAVPNKYICMALPFLSITGKNLLRLRLRQRYAEQVEVEAAHFGNQVDMGKERRMKLSGRP